MPSASSRAWAGSGAAADPRTTRACEAADFLSRATTPRRWPGSVRGGWDRATLRSLSATRPALAPGSPLPSLRMFPRAVFTVRRRIAGLPLPGWQLAYAAELTTSHCDLLMSAGRSVGIAERPSRASKESVDERTCAVVLWIAAKSDQLLRDHDGSRVGQRFGDSWAHNRHPVGTRWQGVVERARTEEDVRD